MEYDNAEFKSQISDLSIYEILGINQNASEDEIKKAYKYLVLKYHPDKNKNINTTEKFIQIHSAYEILMDKNLRKEYDIMQNKDQNELHNKKFEENIKKYINSFFMFFCKDEKYLYNIKKNKYDIAFDYLIGKYIKQEKKSKLDIIDFVECDLIDRYDDNYLLVEIIRKSKNNIKMCVPLRNDVNIYYGEGEIDEIGNSGDLILHTKTKNENGYYCKNGDMFKEIKICSDTENIVYNHIDGRIINIKKSDFIDNKYIIFSGLGLPKSDSSVRGDLVCEFIIS
jgi:DnaJ-class molecular chaperone